MLCFLYYERFNIPHSPNLLYITKTSRLRDFLTSEAGALGLVLGWLDWKPQ